jgi:hypothetical protein
MDPVRIRNTAYIFAVCCQDELPSPTHYINIVTDTAKQYLPHQVSFNSLLTNVALDKTERSAGLNIVM